MVDSLVCGWVGECMGGWVTMDDWMGGCVVGLMGSWMGGWMGDRWLDG